MRYTIVMAWALVIGQVVGYIGGALNHQTFDPLTTLFVSFIAGILVIILGFIMQPKKSKEKTK